MTPRRHRPSAAARREALLRAAGEVAGNVGLAGVTHRAVTEQAGMPLATVSYFFASIDELIEEAVRERAASDAREMIALAESLRDVRAPADDVAQAFAADVTRRLPVTLPFFEVLLHAARHPSSRDAVAEALAAHSQVAAASTRAAGLPEPDATASLFVALTHGLALLELATPGALPPESMQAAFRALFLGLLLDNGHEDLALQLRRP